MPRRRLLICGAALACGEGLLAGCHTAAPRMSGTTARSDAIDAALLNRITWGSNPASLQRASRGSRAAFVQGQLHPMQPAVLPVPVQAQIDALTIQQTAMPALVAQMDQRRRDADAMDSEAARKDARQAWQQEMTRLGREASSRMLLRAVYSPNQLQEQLTWFWFNHFNVHQFKGELRAMVGDYEDRLRSHALGRFRDLLVASATHAAMIRYLDNAQNAVGRLNENYARELMELHTLGVDGGYSQKDVQELARVLTGLGVRIGDDAPRLRPGLQPLYVRDGLMEFNPARHDMDEKLVLGQKVAAGQGRAEIIAQLTRLAHEPATQRHVCRKLAIFLVGDTPPPALVERMVRAFDASDGEIAATLQAMFAAPEFTPSLGRQFKDPMHYVVSAARLVANEQPGLNTEPMLGWLNRLGEGLYNRQTPDGYPLDEAAWSGSGQMSARFEIARAIGSGSAKLMRSEETAGEPLSLAALDATLGPATRAALDAAASPQERNVVLLSSPEFMYR